MSIHANSAVASNIWTVVYIQVKNWIVFFCRLTYKPDQYLRIITSIGLTKSVHVDSSMDSNNDHRRKSSQYLTANSAIDSKIFTSRHKYNKKRFRHWISNNDWHIVKSTNPINLEIISNLVDNNSCLSGQSVISIIHVYFHPFPDPGWDLFFLRIGSTLQTLSPILNSYTNILSSMYLRVYWADPFLFGITILWT